MSETEQAIASLRSSIDALHATVSEIQAQAAGKAEASASATCTLTSRKYSEGSGEVHIKPGEAVELLRMGKFVFHGETARQIRAAQTVLRQAGAGQLEVVKRVEDPSSPFVVIDGQVFIPDAKVKSAVVDPDRFKIKMTENGDGKWYASGFNLNAEPQLFIGSEIKDALRKLIRDELQPGGMLHRGMLQRS